jgi:predicted RNA binding protein YcfA (HicA-like mRNA interferase family)
MAKCEKLLEKAKNSPNNLHFDDLCKLAKCYGWEFDRQEGSHAIYLHRSLGNVLGSMMNFQNADGKAKRGQVKQLLNAIEEHGL